MEDIDSLRRRLDRFEASKRLRLAILAHLKRYRRKCSSAQRLAVAHEREHVRRLPADQLVAYVRTRGPLIGFTLLDEVQS